MVGHPPVCKEKAVRLHVFIRNVTLCVYRPGQSSQIRSNYRSEFYRSLELLLSSSSNSKAAREASATTAVSGEGG